MKTTKRALAVLFFALLSVTTFAQNGEGKKCPKAEMTPAQIEMKQAIKAKKEAYKMTLSDAEKREVKAIKDKRKATGKESLTDAEKATMKRHKAAFLSTLNAEEKAAVDSFRAMRKERCQKRKEGHSGTK